MNYRKTEKKIWSQTFDSAEIQYLPGKSYLVRSSEIQKGRGTRYKIQNEVEIFCFDFVS